jgi:tRNA dimethylallyltransferase
MNKLLVILGPTATGKTDLALDLAKKFNGELVAADSRQVYKGLDLGTGKLPGVEAEVKKGDGFWEINGIKIWMYDVADPKEQFTVKDYTEQASRVVDEINKQGKLPIVVGGTGFYIQALLEGLPNLAVPTDEKLRGELQKLSLEELQKKLQSLSPTRWEKLNSSDRQNPRRLLRSIELTFMNPYRNTIKKSKVLSQKYEILKIGLTAPRQVLYDKIDRRLVLRTNQGMIEEAKSLLAEGVTLTRMKELGLEYGVLSDLLAGEINEDQFVKILGTKIHHFAKRQLTWFKKEQDINWFDITTPNYQSKVEKMVGSW